MTVKPPRPIASSFKIAITFLIAVTVIFSGLIYLALNQSPRLQTSLQAFSTLHEAYEQKGTEGFRQAKLTLRRQIANSKSSTNPEAQLASFNIAVYLFPALLPPDNFERQLAMELWAPLQEAIEKAPRTYHSRLWFEEMRANIWNYENADRRSPRLSEYASQVIRVYERLSSP